jgi:crossover junction endodeoxyribonuclease RusA
MGAHSAPDPFADMLDGEFVPGLLVRHWSGRKFLSPRARVWLLWIGALVVTIVASIAVFAAFTAAAL